MKRMLFVFLIGSLCAALHAADFEPFAASVPATSMQSVNNSSYMTSGSAYSGTVYTVGASELNNAPSRPGQIRRGGPGTDSSGYDPNNPQFSPIGDALIPLLLMVMVYATVLFLRRRRKRA
jgi:hypothetical protein